MKSDNKRLETELMEITLMTEKIDQDTADERKALVKRLTEELNGLKDANQLVKVSNNDIIIKCIIIVIKVYY